jgi:hypothetical protein
MWLGVCFASLSRPCNEVSHRANACFYDFGLASCLVFDRLFPNYNHMPDGPVDSLKMIGSVDLEALTKLIPLRRRWFSGWGQLIGYMES